MKRLALAQFVLSIGSVFFNQGCDSSQPPVHLNPNMDIQPKYKAQAKSDFFANGSTMQPPVAGTVARGDLDRDPRIEIGKGGSGDFLTENPFGVESPLLERGQERYRIYCQPCHGREADGQSPVADRAGITESVNLLNRRIGQTSPGQIFDVITRGSGLMPGYGKVIPPRDRWAIVAHLQTLLGEER